MWLLRGGGMTGLAGMPYVREERILTRPLLAATREEVMAYLDHEELSYRLDSSNEKPFYHRNRIRKELLPVITRLAPSAVRVLQRQADLLREDEQYLTGITNELVHTLVSHHSTGVQRVDRQAFVQLPVALQRRLVRAILRTYDEEGRASSFHMVESVRRVLLKGGSGVRLSFKRSLWLWNRGRLRFSPSVGGGRSHQIDSEQKKREMLAVPVPSTVSWAGMNQPKFMYNS